MKKENSDNFLARWLNNDLSDKELREFKQSPDFLLYQKIAEKSSELSAPEFHKEALFNSVKKALSTPKKQKTRLLFNRIMYPVAASIILVLGLFYFMKMPKTHTTGYGEQATVVLPDNSKVILNSKTTIRYQEDNWGDDRSIELDGEAYFMVEKGSKFTVETKQGNVAVLGTHFNVKNDEDFFEVVCYEGKVQVETPADNEVLTQGNAFRKQKDTTPEKWNTRKEEPTWKNGESSFKSVPLKHVIKALENQYKITFDSSKIDTQKKFTGSFTHKNFKIALQTVFVPMKIGTTFRGEKTIVLEALNE